MRKSSWSAPLPRSSRGLKAQIASRETFARYGLDYPAFLSSVTVQPQTHCRRPRRHQAALRGADHRAVRHAAGRSELGARPARARVHRAARSAGVHAWPDCRRHAPGRGARRRATARAAAPSRAGRAARRRAGRRRASAAASPAPRSQRLRRPLRLRRRRLDTHRAPRRHAVGHRERDRRRRSAAQSRAGWSRSITATRAPSTAT